MTSTYESIMRIVDSNTSHDIKLVAIKSFAHNLRWTPSYDFKASFGVPAAEDHLVVEHGLENSAIISFLKSPSRASELSDAQLRALLSISYNNLIDWHIFVSQTDIRQVYNLAPLAKQRNFQRIYPLNPNEAETRLSIEEFNKLFETKEYQQEFQACDDALMIVLSRWKRLLKSDYPNSSNAQISALFNAIIFVRGCEDRDLDRAANTNRTLVSIASQVAGENVDIKSILDEALSRARVNQDLSSYIDTDKINVFSELDKSTALNLLRDFYAPKEAAYEFNFALMSKHALSRIYERYVSLLRPEDSSNPDQLHFFSQVPEEVSPSKTGAVYTPQFISSFFSRYIRENTTPKKFREIKVLDPACGSGIFLRNMLELKCNPIMPNITNQAIEAAFNAAEGIDRDPNACEATRLSLALLHLASTGRLPNNLHVREADAIKEAFEGNISAGSFGAVLTNPPYIKYDDLSAAERELYGSYLGPDHSGRFDAYIPFLKICLSAVEISGFICMVLPQTFLSAENASQIRREILDNFYIRCLVDLSAVRVFGDVGAYSILLIVQRKSGIKVEINAQIAQISGSIGPALQACIDGISVSSPYHQVFDVSQDYFSGKVWNILNRNHVNIIAKIENFAKLSDYFDVMQGFVTGADDIFIRSAQDIPDGEEDIYLDYVPDRKIARYAKLADSDKLVFYPYYKGNPVTEPFLRERFPQTYEYLRSNRDYLENRGPVKSSKTHWWRPERPREPHRMLRQKIICPHLMLTPRFTIDVKAHVAVSRSPYLAAKDINEGLVIAKFYLAILNSSFFSWYMKSTAPKYGGGYNRIEANFLRDVPVPNFSKVDHSKFMSVLSIVDRLLNKGINSDLDEKLNKVVAEIYNLDRSEMIETLGMEA